MRNLFNSVRRPAVQYNNFDLSFPNTLSADYGVLYPCLVKEINAGEVIRDFTANMVRTQPLTAPAFIRSDVSIHYFFVPFRLCYEDWSKFITRGDDGDTDYDKPYITCKDFFEKFPGWGSLFRHGSLMDYLNFPTLGSDSAYPDDSLAKVDLMPFNAYSLVYNEYYRDENLIPEVLLWKHSGYINNYNEFTGYVEDVLDEWYHTSDPNEFQEEEARRASFPMFLRFRAWRKDYFTSALPFVQKGTPISLAGAVVGQPGQTGIVNDWFSSIPVSDSFRFFVNARRPSESDVNNIQLYLSQRTSDNVAVSDDSHYHTPTNPSNYFLNSVTPIAGLQGSVMTISDLRVGLALQQWFELNARTGSARYFEYLLGHFGVRDRDARLQRPEYLGGFTHSIQVSEVEQTSSTNQVSPQGNLAGKGLGYSESHPVRYRAPEPGYLLAILSIRPQAVYFRGMPRCYQRWDAFDYYDPLFDHLSEQAIYTSELFFDWFTEPHGEEDPVFGYTPRFSEYRTSLAECHGDFRESLAYWLSPRRIDNLVQLNKDFIEVNGYSQDLYQSFAFQSNLQKPAAHFLVHMVHNLSILRPMSKYATPK